ncbi:MULTISPECIES: hypothetical protein [unclassified Streptomyces]|uniref:hypothetical protein n=1 Tax=unclassified Streptomyces TaxID=2593676 RepID=UPI0006B013C8|nr:MULTISPECIES: hypothetical protein [unclassified Streptomyces]KOU86621.1 hypothetical protein ADK93_19255 [Streptomyces sp. XY58]KOV09719.1 hypothetical protein ADK89_06310 [Streptomyces sp. XY37]KOV47404.1 hypothetical protein ADK99_19800 [Streptomyces sp. MMG1064]
MIIALFVFLAVGVLVAATPGAVLGYAFVAVSGGLSHGKRVGLLLPLAAASASAWLTVVGADNTWRLPTVTVSFIATLVSGATFLGREANRLRAARFRTGPWPNWQPPAGPHGGR